MPEDTPETVEATTFEERIARFKELFEVVSVDAEKGIADKNKKACRRARNALNEMKRLAVDLRKDLLSATK